MTAPVGPAEVVFRVELYDLFAKPTRNGWLVARYVDGCRAGTVKPFGIDHDGAHRFAASLNKDFGIRKAG